MSEEQKVVVVDIHMKFWSMVVFLVRLAVAAIPAGLILFVIGLIFSALFYAIFGR